MKEKDFNYKVSQKLLCNILSKAFAKYWSFVGFYDHHPNGGKKEDGTEYNADQIYLGEWVSEEVDPSLFIPLGKG